MISKILIFSPGLTNLLIISDIGDTFNNPSFKSLSTLCAVLLVCLAVALATLTYFPLLSFLTASCSNSNILS